MRYGSVVGDSGLMYTILSRVNGLFATLFDATTVPDGTVRRSSGSLIADYVLFGLSIVIPIVIYTYFFQNNVRSFFGISESQKWRVFLPQVGIAVVIIVVTSFVMKGAQ
jgi:hypothetical protein